MSAYQFSASQHAETVQEFLAVCRTDREVARHHLAAGYFEPWLLDQGRPDLAARAAKVRHDPEGLELFLKTARPSARRKAA